ncbi:hypothetical protein ATANTOWER_024547, partial [Ataeniobius toweri]|nr:hypothetical protein [Ataeniobius toweri]
QPGFLVTGPSFQSLNKITKTFLVSECSLHVGQVGSQNYDNTASSIVGHGEAGAYVQQSMGRRWGTPWTGRQSIAGQI